MFKKILIFGAGALFGIYAYRNCLRDTAIRIIMANALRPEEPKTSETEKES